MRDHAALWRWTDGNAVVTLSAEGPVVLEIVVAGSLNYPLCQHLGTRTARATGSAPAKAAAA